MNKRINFLQLYCLHFKISQPFARYRRLKVKNRGFSIMRRLSHFDRQFITLQSSQMSMSGKPFGARFYGL